MVRTAIGGVVAGLILFFVGFVFWATPLAELALSDAGEAESAAVQASLAQNLTGGGTGTYIIPNPKTPQGTTLYGQGPIATVHFNTNGFAVEDMGMVVGGLILAIFSGMLIAFGLAAVGGGGRSFTGVARLVVFFSLGITTWTVLGQPVFNHYGWGYWIYSFVAETTALIVAGLVVAKWFLPRYDRPAEARREAPATEG
jgi:hypothetical protein